MNHNDRKTAGYALILGSILLIVTMVLHPTGGSFEHLLKIMTVIVTAHTIAILSIPITLLGFWGFHKSFTKAWGLSTLAFITLSIGLLSGLIAGTLNGLVLPLYINQYRDATPETIAAIMPILKYNGALNHAFDYIFIGFISLAILMWSVAILLTKTYVLWLAYLGIALNLCVLIGLMIDFNFVNLQGFRGFIFGLVGWIVAAGYLLIKAKNEVV
jgi:hypothetical protein